MHPLFEISAWQWSQIFIEMLWQTQCLFSDVTHRGFGQVSKLLTKFVHLIGIQRSLYDLVIWKW